MRLFFSATRLFYACGGRDKEVETNEILSSNNSCERQAGENLQRKTNTNGKWKGGVTGRGKPLIVNEMSHHVTS